MKGKVASILFINKKGQMLLYLRDDKKSIPYPNTWALIGGHVEKGEEILDALRREVHEEIGIDVKNPVFIKEFDDKVGNDVFVYKDKINLSLSDLELTEGQRLKYFSFEEILNQENVPKPLKDFLKKNKNLIE